MKRNTKFKILLFFTSIIFAGCNNQTELEQKLGKAQDEIQSLQNQNTALLTKVQQLSEQKENLKKLLVEDQVGLWGIEWDEEKGDPNLVFVEAIDEDKATVEFLVSVLNRRYSLSKYPGIALEKIEARTAFVKILNGEKLTQRMGTSGAAEYMAIVTYTLSSLKEIDRVYFGFEEGDHASPGFYTRINWLTFFRYW